LNGQVASQTGVWEGDVGGLPEFEKEVLADYRGFGKEVKEFYMTV
jgi:hypothetical protein